MCAHYASGHVIGCQAICTLYICDSTCEKGPSRASFQNRLITTIGKSRL